MGTQTRKLLYDFHPKVWKNWIPPFFALQLRGIQTSKSWKKLETLRLACWDSAFANFQAKTLQMVFSLCIYEIYITGTTSSIRWFRYSIQELFTRNFINIIKFACNFRTNCCRWSSYRHLSSTVPSRTADYRYNSNTWYFWCKPVIISWRFHISWENFL